jgi:hypothetical protein
MTRRRDYIKAIAQSFSGGRWLQGYIQGKLSADPVFDAGVAQPPLDIFEIDHASNTGE